MPVVHRAFLRNCISEKMQYTPVFENHIYSTTVFKIKKEKKNPEQEKHIKIKIENTVTTLLTLTRKLPLTLLLWF